jgi:abortive infection bacteriophage resistance protein
MREKEYKTYRQLLTILRDRGMIIEKGSQGSRVMRILEEENYYNVINGYKDLFLATHATTTTDETYKTGTTFDEIYSLYSFDREVRSIYLKYLLKVENRLKTVISHEFSSKYGYDNYLKLDNFQCQASDLAKVQQISAEENTQSVIKLIGDIQQEIARQMGKYHQVVTHYMTHHGYIPLWVLVNVLTFGKITYFYFNMMPADKAVVAKQFNVAPDELHKIMEMLGLARNKCAHDERFFDISFRRSLHTKSIKNFNTLGITRGADGSYTYGTNDAYAIAIIFALFISKTELNEFISSMKAAFGKLQKQLHTISIDAVMNQMGFGPNWANLTCLKH